MQCRLLVNQIQALFTGQHVSTAYTLMNAAHTAQATLIPESHITHSWKSRTRTPCLGRQAPMSKLVPDLSECPRAGTEKAEHAQPWRTVREAAHCSPLTPKDGIVQILVHLNQLSSDVFILHHHKQVHDPLLHLPTRLIKFLSKEERGFFFHAKNQLIRPSELVQPRLPWWLRR